MTSKSERLTFPDIEAVLRLHNDGRTETEIAGLIGCSQSTVSRHLTQLRQTPELVQHLMRGQTFSALQAWKRSFRAAAKRGDHRPAREWLEAAHPELRPQTAANQGQVGIVINVGMPNNPVRLPDISTTKLALPDAQPSPAWDTKTTDLSHLKQDMRQTLIPTHGTAKAVLPEPE